jgi:energy-coupling factor transporter ATP-binding protein EcfA2
MLLQRGSEWRRWDLHVHTPGTVLNDQFNGWDSYLAAVEAHSHVKVMGVTDYMSIENYSQLKAHRASGRIGNIELLFPNIEFRIAPPSDKATALNIHLLVCPDAPDHETEIRNALGRLDWEYQKRRYSCLPDQLRALGRAFDPKLTDDRAALAMGVTQFKVDFTTFRDWFKKERWLQENAIVAVAAGDDGLSGFQKDGAWAGFREEITRFSQILFSGRLGEREFWIGRTGSDLDFATMERLGGPKPVVQGSDAHKLADLFNPKMDRFCWIKADTTFEGLRQILYEPEDRVFIGPTPPVDHDEARVITAVCLRKSNGWFDDVEIPLNSGLVSIIGQKGSGKSALAEIIAYAAGGWDGSDKAGFLNRAGEHLSGLTIELIWGDGHTTTIRLGQPQQDDTDVRYLSQHFVEQLCTGDRIGTELVKEIEAVIFSYTDPTDTLNASDFEELRALRTEGIRAEGERLREDIKRLIEEECQLRTTATKLSEKKSRIATLTKEKEGLLKQMPKAANAAQAKLQTDLQARRSELAEAQRLIAADKQKLQKIVDIRTRVATFKAQIARFNSDMDTLLADAGIEETTAFRPSIPDVEPLLKARAAALTKSIRDREGSGDSPAAGTLRALEQQIKVLIDQDAADKTRQQRLKTIQDRISSIDIEVKRLDGEIKQIEGPNRERLNSAREERLNGYGAYFDNLKNEQSTLEELYAPVKAKLKDGSAKPQEQDLEFSIRWEVDLKNWLERGGVLFDQRKTIPYGTMIGLAQAAERILLPAWTSGDTQKIKTALESFLEEFRKSELKPTEYLRSGVTLADVLAWLYEVDHIKLSYGLKYNGVELENLSPGTKGIVLLILYLGMDVGDTRPLIVDQPDENLDNESIYALLTTYFKTAKKRRQIILITHNPNLVVNGDSEQIVIATAKPRQEGLPHITYTAGSLENTNPQGVRQQVCRILEGGSVAFLKRERRYALDQA